MIKNSPQLIRIGETYIKFDFEYSESNIQLIQNTYLKEIKYSIEKGFKERNLVKISIEYDKGSLKTRIAIWGTITTIYMGIANYGSFRSGVREIINDVKTFSSYVIEKVDQDPNLDENSIIRFEKRTGLPGRIQELYNRIDKLEKNINNLSNNQIQSELEQIKQEVANLTTVLPAQDSETFLNELDDSYKDNLPQPDDNRVNYLLSRYALKPDDEIGLMDD